MSAFGIVREQRALHCGGDFENGLALGGEVGVAIDLNERRSLPSSDATPIDTAFAATRSVRRVFTPFLRKYSMRLLDVSADFLQSFLTIHHGLTGFRAELVDHGGGDVWHLCDSKTTPRERGA
jgi:hypothetical protein